MTNLERFSISVWLMVVFRTVLRLLLVANGSLEWRGWHIGYEFWPSYVTAWEIINLAAGIFWIHILWRTRKEG